MAQIRMNFNEFKDSIKKLKKFIPTKKNEIPIIKGILIEANYEEDYTQITATNLDEEAQYIPRTQMAPEPGSVVIPLDTLKLLEKINDTEPETNILIEDSQVTIDDRTVKFREQNPSDFPKPISYRFGKGKLLIKEKEPELKDKLKIIDPALDSKDTKPLFQNVLIQEHTMTATDSYRLAWQGITTESDDEVLIPAKTLKKTRDLISSKNKAINNYTEITVAKNIRNEDYNNEYEFACIHFQNMYIYTKLYTDESFPKLDQVIPDNYDCFIRLDTKKLINELTFITKIEKDPTVEINVKSNDDIVTISTQTTDNKIDVDLDAYIEHEDYFIACNARYLLEAVKRYSTGKDKEKTNGHTEIQFSGKFSPILIDEQEIILPVRT